MKILKSEQYTKDYKKKICKVHKYDEMERIRNIEELIIDSNNLKDLIENPLAIVYHIEKKKGNLKEIYTARVNGKIRLYMKPCGEYPYDRIEITSIEFIKIDDRHYNEG